MFTKSGVNAGSSRRLNAAKARAMTDHVCAWAAASPARYRASSSSKAASMSSRSNSDDRRDPVVGVDLDDVEQLGVERLGRRWSRIDTRIRLSDEAFPAGRNDVRRRDRNTEIGDCPHVRDLGIPTTSDPGVHHPTTIVMRNVVGQDLGHGVPVAGREVRPEAFGYSACCVLQPRRRPAELVEPGERGVEVGLVEELAAVDQVAFDRQEV